METKKQNKLPEGLGKKIIQALKEQGSSSPTTLSMAKPDLDSQVQHTQSTENNHGLETISHMDFGSEEFHYAVENHTDLNNNDNYTPELSSFNDIDIDQNLMDYNNQDFSYNEQAFEELPANFEHGTSIEPTQDFDYQDFDYQDLSYSNNIPDLDNYESNSQPTPQEDHSGYQPELNLDYNYLNNYDNFEYQDNAYIDNESENATFQTQEQQEFYKEEILDSSNYEPAYTETNTEDLLISSNYEPAYTETSHTSLDLDAVAPSKTNTTNMGNYHTNTTEQLNDPLNIEESPQQPIEHIGYTSEQISQLEEKIQPVDQINSPPEQQVSQTLKIQEIVEQIDFMSEKKPLFLEKEPEPATPTGSIEKLSPKTDFVPQQLVETSTNSAISHSHITEPATQAGFIQESDVQIGFQPNVESLTKPVIPSNNVPEPNILDKLAKTTQQTIFIPEQQTNSVDKEPEPIMKETSIPQQQTNSVDKEPEPPEQKEFVFQPSEQKTYSEPRSFYNNYDCSNSKILSPKVEKLIDLVSTLPPGVTRQTGAQIIRQTMEAMGIIMSEVLSDAQESQSQLQQQIKESFNRIEEEKILIKTLENDIHKYQYKSKELEEVIKLFVLSDRR